MYDGRRLSRLLGVFLLSFGACLTLSALGSSRSVSPAVMGRYSPVLAVSMILILLALAGVLAFAMLRQALFDRALSGVAGRPLLFELLLSLTLPVALFLWLFRPVPVLGRTTLIAGLILVPSGLCLLLAGAATRVRTRRALQHAALILGSLIVAMVAGELVCRRFMPRLVFDPRFRLRPHMSYRIEVDLPGISPGGRVTTNSLGLRGEEPPEDFDGWLTIVTVGGSTTNNFFLDDSHTWPAVLQTRLRRELPETWVGNAGIPAQTADMHVILIRDVISRLRPDYVVVLAGINEMGPIIRGVVPSHELLEEGGLRNWLFQRSSLVQALYLLKKVHLDGAVPVTACESFPLDTTRLQGPERSLPEDLHEVMPLPDAYRSSILEIARACREAGSVPVFLTQPLLYEDNEYWSGVASESVWLGGSDTLLSAASFWLILQTLNGDMIEACRDGGMHCFDLASHVPHSTEMFWDCMHLTEDGAELVGGLVADFMLREVVEPPPRVGRSTGGRS